jgi:hypothetical protein
MATASCWKRLKKDNRCELLRWTCWAESHKSWVLLILRDWRSPRMDKTSRDGTVPVEAVVLNRETQKVQLIRGIEPHDRIEKWTKDGQALLVTTATPWGAQIYRLEVASGKKTLLQKVELSEKAGSIFNMRAYYAEDNKTYVYGECSGVCT